MTDPPADPYKALQVDPEAEDEVIAAAYRRLARKYHPDVGGGPEAAARMTALNAAWELIGEPGRRAAFDRQRAVEAALDRRTAEAEAGAGAGGGYPSTPASRPAGDRVARLVERPFIDRQWLRRIDADGRRRRRRRHPAGQPIGQRAELRPLCRLVAR